MFNSFKKRESGVELLKIICIFLIVLSHIVQTLGKESYLEVTNYLVDYSTASADPTNITLALFKHCGHIGTIIFFICSAWYMFGKEDWNNKKIIRLWIEVFFISLFFLVCLLIAGFAKTIDTKSYFKAIFPICTGANWYITFYICFALLCPLLNKLLKKVNLWIVFAVSIVLFALGYIVPKSMSQGPSLIACYLMIYFIRSKNESLCNKYWFNIILTVVGLGLFIGTFILLDNYGLKVTDTEYTVTWQVFYGNLPFYIFGFGIFNLFRQMKFKNGVINFISSTSLICYVVHENSLLRSYARPLVWEELYAKFGHYHLITQSLLFSVALFLACILFATIYKLLLQKWVYKFADFLSNSIRKLTSKITTKKLQDN